MELDIATGETVIIKTKDNYIIIGELDYIDSYYLYLTMGTILYKILAMWEKSDFLYRIRISNIESTRRLLPELEYYSIYYSCRWI